MCWAGIINGDIILHWFPVNTSVNQHVYLEMLENVLWPAVRSVSTRRMYCFQQDGATAHCTNMVMNWLRSKFGERVISRNADHPWPSRSPDLSPLDYLLWSVCLRKLRKEPPNSMDELQDTVDEFVHNLNRRMVIKSARDIQVRAKACKEAKG